MLTAYSDSIALYSRALALQPELAEGYRNRAMVLRLMKRYNESLNDFTKAISLDPKNEDLYEKRAGTCEDMKLNEQALADYDRAMKLVEASDSPGDLFELHSRRAHALIGAKRCKEAIAEYNIQLKEEQSDISSAWILSLRGEAHQLLKENESAIVDYTKALACHGLIDQKYDTAKPEETLTYGQHIYEMRASAYEAAGKPKLAAADKKKAADFAADVATRRVHR